MSDNEGVESAPDADGGSGDEPSSAEPGDASTAGTSDEAAPDADSPEAEAAGEQASTSDGESGTDGTTTGETAADADAASDEGSEEDGTTTKDELVERVAEQPPEAVAEEIHALRERVDDLEGDLEAERETVEDLQSTVARKQADFQNYKKRQQKKLEDQRRRATESLVERLLDVRDNLVRALDQEEGADIRDGVEATLRQFDQVLDAESVETIDPEPGAEVDPVRHEVLMRVDSDQPAGTVADIHRPGYEMAGKVIRPAQVTVAEE